MRSYSVKIRDEVHAIVSSWDLPTEVVLSMYLQVADMLECPRAFEWLQQVEGGHVMVVHADGYKFRLLLEFYDETFHVMEIHLQDRP